MPPISATTDQLVRDRARHKCEYCRMPQSLRLLKFQIDHVIARQHGGDDEPENLALWCGRCNRRKGPNISSVDPATGTIWRLFNPRTDVWNDHFSIRTARIEGISETGRATVLALNLNHLAEVAVREEMIDSGLWP